MIEKLKSSALALCVAAVLSACGGGGDGADNPVSTASTAPSAALQGAYEGTTNTVNNPAFTMLVLEDGSTWLLYGDRIGGFLYTSGLMQGTVQFSNGALNSSANFRDYGYEPAEAVTLKGNYDGTPSLSGTFSINGETGKFQASRPATTLYNYDAPANLAEIAGAWSTTSPEGYAVTVQISADGTYAGVDAFGCTASGKLTPRPSGKNVFNLSFQMGSQASCDLPNQTGSGVAVVYDLADGRQQIVLMVVDNVQKFGTAYMGARSKSL